MNSPVMYQRPKQQRKQGQLSQKVINRRLIHSFRACHWADAHHVIALKRRSIALKILQYENISHVTWLKQTTAHPLLK